MARLVLAARRQHPTWGPRKLLAWLERQHRQRVFPAASTVGELLKRHGLVKARRRTARPTPYTQPLSHCHEPNDVWCTDFKGSFCTGDGVRCHPLTISDGASRFLVRCEALAAERFELVQPVFIAAFGELGLPRAIRSDNGPPFASIGGLSRLAVWWVKLGIRPERIEPAHPEQNGRHERMHRTLKHETAAPPQPNLRRQQRAFTEFRHEYNQERPHQALDQKTPASVYRASPRRLPSTLARIEYPSGYEVRSVRRSGAIKWRGGEIHISEALLGEPIALEPIDDGLWLVRFSFVELGVIDETLGKPIFRRPYRKRLVTLLPMSPV
jgi:transposase InsO family protein